MTALSVNGVAAQVNAAEQTPLLDVLRHELGLTSARLGCGLGQCGACHVLVDGQSVPACDTPLWSVQDKEVLTLEAVHHADACDRARRVLRALQEAFVHEQAAQCGFCTSGILMSATALLQQTPEPSVSQIHAALDRHLCRCGAHWRIVRAVQRAATHLCERGAA